MGKNEITKSGKATIFPDSKETSNLYLHVYFRPGLKKKYIQRNGVVVSRATEPNIWLPLCYSEL